jgi:DNA polymerase III subunit delta'
MRFGDVRHQDRAISIIRRALRSGRTHHAYLFEGPEGVGKELAARALAARLLCQEPTLAPDADACGTCNACRMFASDNHPDFHLIHRGLHKFHPDPKIRRTKGLFLVIDVVRHFLIEPAAMKPAYGQHRVFLIRDPERMNEAAQNALLKTLEEPPGEARLILVTSSAARLLPTIRSRSQVVPFQLLPVDFVRAELVRQLALDTETATALAGLSEGRLGVALRWRQIDLLETLDAVAGAIADLKGREIEGFAKTLAEIATTLAKRARKLSAAATDEDEELDDADDVEDEDEEDGADRSRRSSAKTVPTDELRDALKLILLLIAALYRDALLASTGAAAPRFVPRAAAATADLAAYAPEQLDVALRGVNEAERMLDRNVAPQMVGEHLAVALLGELPAGAV